MSKPIKTYQLSIIQPLKRFTVLMTIAVLFFIWWLDIEHIQDVMIAVVFLLFFIGGSLFYAWIKRKKTSICIYKEGLYVQQQFLPWGQIQNIDLKQTDVETINYSMVVYKNDNTKITSNLDFLDQKSDVVFRSVKGEFDSYIKNNSTKK